MHLGVPPLNTLSGSGNVHVYLFGGEIHAGGGSSGVGGDGSVDPSTSIGFDFNESSDVGAPGITIQIWIFEIEVDAHASVGLEAKGKIDVLNGLHFEFGPHADVGAHAFGGVNVGIASGGVDVDIPDLFHAALTANADAKWSISKDPTQCNVGVKFDANATAGISSGGGHVSLVASFGKCPFCWDNSWDVFDWKGLGSIPPEPLTIFDTGPQTLVAVELPSPTTTCDHNLNVGFTTQSTIPMGFPAFLSGSASLDSVTVLGSNSTPPDTSRTWTWSSSVLGDILPQGNNSGNATFVTTGPRTLTLTVTDTVHDSKGTPIPLSGTSAPQTVTVNALSNGVYILSVLPPLKVVPYNGSGYVCPTHDTCVITTVFDVPQADMSSGCGPLGCTGSPAALAVTGSIVGAPGPTSTNWTITDTTTNTITTVPVPPASDPSAQPILIWTPPNLTDRYAITITTKVSGTVYGTETVTLGFVTPPH